MDHVAESNGCPPRSLSNFTSLESRDCDYFWLKWLILVLYYIICQNIFMYIIMYDSTSSLMICAGRRNRPKLRWRDLLWRMDSVVTDITVWMARSLVRMHQPRVLHRIQWPTSWLSLKELCIRQCTNTSMPGRFTSLSMWLHSIYRYVCRFPDVSRTEDICFHCMQLFVHLFSLFCLKSS